MISDLEQIYSVNIKNMKNSIISELLKLTQRPEVISFAGGLHYAVSFPIDKLKDIKCEVLYNDGT